MTIAVLFCDPRGTYADVPGLELWDEKRDARLYAGPHPVVAHPPCSRWCRLAGLVEARWGHKRGQDDGEFASALHSVRTYGGVLEHPAYSDAWDAFGLLRPPTGGGWVKFLYDPGWTCYVEQVRYGHAARKATWLYYVGSQPPTGMRWGFYEQTECPTYGSRWGGGRSQRQLGGISWCGNKLKSLALVSNCGNHTAVTADRPRLTKKGAYSTPPAFRDALLALAKVSDFRRLSEIPCAPKTPL